MGEKAVTSVTPDASPERSVRSRVVDQVGETLMAGRSVLVLAGPGMDAGHLVSTVARALRRSGDALTIAVPPRPFAGFGRRVGDLVSAIHRVLSTEGRHDAVLAALRDGVAQLLSEARTDHDLGLTLDRCEEIVAEIDAEGVRTVVVISDLRRWLNAGQAQKSIADPADPPQQESGGEQDGLTVVSFLLHLQRNYRFSLLASDGPDADSTDSDPIRRLLTNTDTVWLGPLNEEEVRALVADERPLLTDRDREFITNAVGGHPRLVRILATILADWRHQDRKMDGSTRAGLAQLCDRAVADVVDEALSLLGRSGHGWAADEYRSRGATGDLGSAVAAIHVLRPYGLIDADGRVADRLRAHLVRSPVRTLPTGAGVEADPQPGAVSASDPILELGRKERILFNYLRQRAGSPVSWSELAGAYFAHNPELLEDEDKALRAVRAAVNRINAKLAPSRGTSKSGSKVIRYRRGEGFYVHPESLDRVLS